MAHNGISSILFHTITTIVAVYLTRAYVLLTVTDLCLGYHIHICLRMYLYRHHCKSGNIYKHNTGTHTHTHTHTNASIHICKRRHTFMHRHTYISVCICEHMCIHEYTYTHSHTKLQMFDSGLQR